MIKRHIYLIADGSSSGARGPGGWAFLILSELSDPEGFLGSGHDQGTTNSRMELTAILRGLETIFQGLNPEGKIYVISDSEYAIGVISGEKLAHMNHDLIDPLKRYYATGMIEFQWIRGHIGNKVHDFVDRMARKEYLKAKEDLGKT